ncbi:MAG: DNA polymerase III subunit delta [Patescibacteria group bacterium]|nr:DNA polymerase III subunit delta [Patescibacteria group bacterium]
MIIFLYGQDAYRSRKKLKEVIERYKKIHKTGLSLKYIDVGKLSFKDVEDELKQTSIFKEKKLLILTNVFSNTDFKKSFIKKGKKFIDSENTVLFYEPDKIDKRDALLKFLNKHAKSQEFELLGGLRLKSWIKKEFEVRNGKINDLVLEKFINFVDNNPWQIINEVEKLVNFKNGEQIESKDIELLIRPKVESDIFKTIDAIASKDKKRALKLLKNHLKKGDNPLYLFSMINYQFRNLLIIKDLIEKNLSPFSAGLHPFVVRKSSALANKFSFSELKKIYQTLFKVDLNIKTGKIDPEAALDLFITEI